MNEELEKLLNKYRKLPAFFQIRALPNVKFQAFAKISNSTDDRNVLNNLRIDFMKKLFKATKPSIQLKQMSQFEYINDLDGGLRIPDSIMELLDEKEEKKILDELEVKDIIYFWGSIKEENKKIFLPKILEHIKTSKKPCHEMQIVAAILKSNTPKNILELYAVEIYQTFRGYSFEEHSREEDANKKNKVISNAMLPIWNVLTQEQKIELVPQLLEEIERIVEAPFDLPEYVNLVKDFEPTIQKKFYDKILAKILPKILNSRSLTNWAEIFFNKFSLEVQLEKIDSLIKLMDDNYCVSALEIFWKELDPVVQNKKHGIVLSRERWNYWDLYKRTNGKLQSILLDDYLKSSLQLNSEELTEDLKAALSNTSYEVFDKNFQYLFGKSKKSIIYAKHLLEAVPDSIKQKYSSAIGKYFSINIEEYLKGKYSDVLLSSGRYLNEESSGILVRNLLDFSKNNVVFEDYNGEIVDLNKFIRTFFGNLDIDTQHALIDEILLEEKNCDLFSKVFNVIKFNSEDEKTSLIIQYLKIKGLDEENIAKRMDLFQRLNNKNMELSTTISLEFLATTLVEELSDEQLLRLTHYVDAQNQLNNYQDNKTFIEMFGYLLDTPENWTISADTIFKKLHDPKNNFNILLDNINGKKLNENELKNLIEILLSDNYFELVSYEDIRDFQDVNGKKNKIIAQIFNGDYDNLPERLKNTFNTENKLKQFALSEYLFNMSPKELEHIIKNYYDGINEITDIPDNNIFNKELGEIRKYLKLCNLIMSADSTEIDTVISYILNPEKHVKKYPRMNMESRIINVYGKSIENDLYKPEEHADEFSFSDIYNDNGTEKNISVFRIKEDFNAIVRVEGAYSGFKCPEDFKEYYEFPNINCHGNCESIIGNDLIAPAKESNDSVAVGYSTLHTNALLLLGPLDLVSSGSNTKLAPVNYQNNCQFLGVEENKNRTRHTHNEIVEERLIVLSDGTIEKLKPSYIIWFEEELGESCPPDQTDEKFKKWEIAKQAAAQLDVPIVVINREYYAQRETEKMNALEEILKGNKPFPEGHNIPEIMEQLILIMENNSNSLRFSNKINMKYFTSDDRERINELLQSKIAELSKNNPELAYECLQKILPRYMYEQDNSESNLISKFYKQQIFNMQALKEKLENFLDKNSDLVLEITEQQKAILNDFIEKIARTDFYKNQKQHSIEHIEKVMFFSQILAQNEGLSSEDTKVLLAAAAFHDSSRNGNDHAKEHAEEGAKNAGTYFSDRNNSFDIKQEDVPIIQVAIEYHEFNEKPIGTLDIDQIKKLCTKYNVQESDFERTLKIAELLKDADALDRTRFAKRGTLDTKYLKSKTAKLGTMVSLAQKTNDEYAGRILQKNYAVPTSDGKNVEILREQRLRNTEHSEIPLTTEEMKNLFDEMIKRRRAKTSIQEKLDMLFLNYGENGIGVRDLQNSGIQLEEDRIRLKHEREEKNVNQLDTGDDAK